MMQDKLHTDIIYGTLENATNFGIWAEIVKSGDKTEWKQIKQRFDLKHTHL